MGVDVLIAGIGSTVGLRTADAALRDAIARAGAGVALVHAQPPREVRTLMLTDLAWARAARVAALRAIAEQEPRAIVYSATTSALFWPRPGAIRYDALGSDNRPGRHGLWQRPLERRRLEQAPVLVPWSGTPDGRHVVVPVPVAPSGSVDGSRDVAAVTYGANASKKGLDRVLAAWALARRPGEELVVAGARDLAAVARTPDLVAAGVRDAGLLDGDAFRALLRRARVFVTAPRREDHGIVQLEALADGARLVTTTAAGPYAALPLARSLDSRLVVEDADDAAALAAAIRTALDAPVPDYAARAAALLEPFTPAAVDRVVAEQLLPRLLG